MACNKADVMFRKMRVKTSAELWSGTGSDRSNIKIEYGQGNQLIGVCREGEIQGLR